MPDRLQLPFRFDPELLQRELHRLGAAMLDRSLCAAELRRRLERHSAGRRLLLEAGTSWYLRLSDPRSVVNNSASDRVHMVVDAEVNDWISAVLAGASNASMPDHAPAGC